MFQEYFASSELMLLPLIGMCLFLAAFAGILYWVLVILRDSPHPEYMAHLPLSDGSIVAESQEEPSHD